MTKEKSYKRRVRARMSKTGESYTAARSHVSHWHASLHAYWFGPGRVGAVAAAAARSTPGAMSLAATVSQ